ncbi:MAG: hypothetical protein WKF47_04565 [Geodermatophilaceae bacterium]
MGRTFLVVAVHRSPRPARLTGQHGEPTDVWMQAKITDRRAGIGAGQDHVVEPEGVEDRRHADSPGGGGRQLGHRHRLHPSDAGVVDEGEGNAMDAGILEIAEELTRLLLPRSTVLDLHCRYSRSATCWLRQTLGVTN